MVKKIEDKCPGSEDLFFAFINFIRLTIYIACGPNAAVLRKPHQGPGGGPCFDAFGPRPSGPCRKLNAYYFSPCNIHLGLRAAPKEA